LCRGSLLLPVSTFRSLRFVIYSSSLSSGFVLPLFYVCSVFSLRFFLRQHLAWSALSPSVPRYLSCLLVPLCLPLSYWSLVLLVDSVPPLCSFRVSVVSTWFLGSFRGLCVSLCLVSVLGFFTSYLLFPVLVPLSFGPVTLFPLSSLP